MLRINCNRIVNKSKFYIDKCSKSLLEGIQWSKKGFWSFYLNFKSTNLIIYKRSLGHSLTYNEKHLIRTTINDTLKLVPLSLFFLIPFAEFGLPFALKIFPNMLPSTFTFNSIKEREMKKIEFKKLEILNFNAQMKELILKLLHSKDPNTYYIAKQLEEIQKNILTQIDIDKIKIAELFSGPIRHSFELENLKINTLRSISKLMDIYPIGNKFILSLRIRYKFLKIKKEDKEILWNRAENIDEYMQKKILMSRFIDPLNKNPTEINFKDSVLNWVELSSMNEIPLSILLWIQTTKLMSKYQNEEILEKIKRN